MAHLHDPYQIVVATEPKLRHCFQNPDYAWLREGANALIIDEAHRAVGPTFTSLINELGI